MIQSASGTLHFQNCMTHKISEKLKTTVCWNPTGTGTVLNYSSARPNSVYANIVSSMFGRVKALYTEEIDRTAAEIEIADGLQERKCAVSFIRRYLRRILAPGSCSEATLVALFGARNRSIAKYQKEHPKATVYEAASKLVGYYSDQNKNRSAVAPFWCLTAIPPEGSTSAVVLPGCSSLDRGSREAEVGFEPRAFWSVNSQPYHPVRIPLDTHGLSVRARGSNATSVTRLPLSRLVRPGSIPALVTPTCGMSARHRKGATAGQSHTSCSVERAGLISMIHLRKLRTGVSRELCAADLEDAIKEDISSGLLPFFAHSSVERAGLISMIHLRKLRTGVSRELCAADLEDAIKEDISSGLLPFFLSLFSLVMILTSNFGYLHLKDNLNSYIFYGCSSISLLFTTLGTTGCCAFDNLKEIGPVCEQYDIWLHVDAAYAGSAFICPEFRPLLDGIEHAMSFVFNPHKWLLTNFDCTCIWYKNVDWIIKSFCVDPSYLKHTHQGCAPDFRVVSFQALTHSFGKEIPLAQIVHVHLARHFEQLLLSDQRFEIVYKVTLGLVCFRVKNNNELTQKLYEEIKADGRIHLVSSEFHHPEEIYFIRFVICYPGAEEVHNNYAFEVIEKLTDRLLPRQEGTNQGHPKIEQAQETMIPS
ncbi:LOW QUALITY PROTEIN: hypothetical protein T265_12524 [Opisthorchis viverrini]|uniref:Aromatic-L-amino-acid decarboxylase n=1 Tax=Opisthorchis viverrini TaxID=6198 RepID=A0A075A2J1_OPIVI|nr:LOW QUALITY PROTEIN: hypothetical protein T265_12524 [Opisthorchis viverrini]KER33938.1 LOW QUALITY PROTEIN: hypothetical protein T265_12524 [Opisthorchis viverrini]